MPWSTKVEEDEQQEQPSQQAPQPVKIIGFCLSCVCLSSQVDLPQGQSCCSSPSTKMF